MFAEIAIAAALLLSPTQDPAQPNEGIVLWKQHFPATATSAECYGLKIASLFPVPLACVDPGTFERTAPLTYWKR